MTRGRGDALSPVCSIGLGFLLLSVAERWHVLQRTRVATDQTGRKLAANSLTERRQQRWRGDGAKTR